MSTQERQYTTMDRTKWDDGPWASEPDKVQWIDATTGLDCIAVRNRVGAWCGYVGVPQSHPWHGIGYGDCIERCGEPRYGGCEHDTPDAIIEVHGGITYSELCQDGPESDSICHLPFDGRPDHVWWFGFDCAHGFDVMPGLDCRFPWPDAEYRTLTFVREQCASMAAQLTALTEG